MTTRFIIVQNIKYTVQNAGQSVIEVDRHRIDPLVQCASNITNSFPIVKCDTRPINHPPQQSNDGVSQSGYTKYR